MIKAIHSFLVLMVLSVLWSSDLKAQCDLPERFVGNTGVNMTVMLTVDFINSLPIDAEGAYVVAITESGMVVGSADVYGFTQNAIAIWGNDALTTEIDGALNGEVIYMRLVNGTDLYDIKRATVVYATGSIFAQYSVKETSLIDCDDDIESTYGCTDPDYMQFNQEATDDDGSCSTLIVLGCKDLDATNYDENANVNDGSCEYDLITRGSCEVNFNVVNTGFNHTILIPDSFITPLSASDVIGVFYTSENGSVVCAGFSRWTGGNTQIFVYGDDPEIPGVNGLVNGAPLLFLARSNNVVYRVQPTFRDFNMSTFSVHGLSIVSDLRFDEVCTRSFNAQEVGVQKLEDLDMELYPNPASDKLYLSMKNTCSLLNIQVVNTLGTVFLERELRDVQPDDILEFNIEDLPNGIYMFKISTNLGLMTIPWMKYF